MYQLVFPCGARIPRKTKRNAPIAKMTKEIFRAGTNPRIVKPPCKCPCEKAFAALGGEGEMLCQGEYVSL